MQPAATDQPRRGPAIEGSLGRVEIASLLWNAGEQVYLVGLLVFAFRIGGAAAVAALGLLQAAPAALLGPLIIRSTRSVRVERLLEGLVAVRAVAIAGAAASMASGASVSVFALAIVDALAASVARPTRSALSPRLARSTAELLTSNVRISGGRSAAALAGPAAAAVLLAQGHVVDTMWLGAALLAVAFLVSLTLRASAPLPAASVAAHEDGGGLATLSRLRHPLVIAGVLAGHQLVRGMVPVILVSLALVELDAGDAGVGVLNAALGAGGLIGGALAFAVAHRITLAIAFSLGSVVWGIGLLVPGLEPVLLPAALALLVGGIGRSIVEVAGVTLLQRTVPVRHRHQVFGIVEALATLALAVGAVAAAVLVGSFGPVAAALVAGAFVIVLGIATWPVVRSVDDAVVLPEAEIGVIQAVPMFRPLSLSTTEEIAAALHHLEVEPGRDVIRQGDHGDRFYIVETGRLEVFVDGSRIRQLDAGDSFGEIALIRDMPRTATVRAVDHTRLAAIDRDAFLAAVSGRRDAAAAAEQVIQGLLG